MKKTFVFYFLLVVSCETKATTNTNIEGSEKLSIGKLLFENESYEQAENMLEEALGVAGANEIITIYTLLGYSQLRQGELENAHESFQNVIIRNEDDVDAKVGILFLEYAYFKNYDRVINLGEEVLIELPEYAFQYDESVNYEDVILHMAFADFYKKAYVNAYNRIIPLTTQRLNSSDPAFIHELSTLLFHVSQDLN